MKIRNVNRRSTVPCIFRSAASSLELAKRLKSDPTTNAARIPSLPSSFTPPRNATLSPTITLSSDVSSRNSYSRDSRSILLATVPITAQMSTAAPTSLGRVSAIQSPVVRSGACSSSGIGRKTNAYARPSSPPDPPVGILRIGRGTFCPAAFPVTIVPRGSGQSGWRWRRLATRPRPRCRVPPGRRPHDEPHAREEDGAHLSRVVAEVLLREAEGGGHDGQPDRHPRKLFDDGIRVAPMREINPAHAEGAEDDAQSHCQHRSGAAVDLAPH